MHLYHRHYLHPKVDYQPLSGKRARTPPWRNVDCTRVCGGNRVYHCAYNLSSNRSAMTSCLPLQGWGGSLLRRHFYFSSRTPRDLHDAPKQPGGLSKTWLGLRCDDLPRHFCCLTSQAVQRILIQNQDCFSYTGIKINNESRSSNCQLWRLPKFRLFSASIRQAVRHPPTFFQ